MSGRAIIGVDIGTQGTKAAAFAPDGRCLARAFRKSRLLRPMRGVVEEDPERQFATVCQTIRECVREAGLGAGSMAGIGIDGQMAGVIGVGVDGKNITPYDSWLDTRCSRHIEIMNRTAGDEVLRKTGNVPSFNHGPKILWWMHNRKAVFRKTGAFVQPGGYAAMRLCGLSAADAFIDTTYLHFSGFADNRRSCWDEGLCETFGLDQAKLPRIVRPQEIIGELCGTAARRCGLRAGVPVVAGCGDTAAAFLACGATKPGVCVDVSGTACVFAATTDSFQSDVRHRTLGCGQAAMPGLWHLYAYINGGGMNLQWFLGEIAHVAPVAKKTLDLQDLNRMAEKLGDDEPLPFFVPHMEGRACPSQPYMKGAWVGLSRKHTLAHLYKSVLESVAMEYAVYTKAIRAIYPDLRFTDTRVTGGGADSEFWNKMKASVLGLPIVTVVDNCGAPAGTAMVAGVGVGLFDNVEEAAKRWVSLGRRFRPSKKAAKIYESRIELYESLLDVMNQFGVQARVLGKGKST